MISSYSGGTSVQERAVEEPEDEQADPDGDRNSNFFEFAFGGDPLNHPDSSYLDVGTYDNWARVAIRERMSDAERLAYISANFSLEAEYVRGSDWGGGVGGILYTARGSVLSWAHYNGRGDVTARSSATGALTYAASYEAYGTRTQEAGANADRQRANTKDEDPTGLLNEGMRYRDLETGLFISRDPMGFVDGPNVYTYVRQNPWSSFDPLGLQESKRSQIEAYVKEAYAMMNSDVATPEFKAKCQRFITEASNGYQDNLASEHAFKFRPGSPTIIASAETVKMNQRASGQQEQISKQTEAVVAASSGQDLGKDIGAAAAGAMIAGATARTTSAENKEMTQQGPTEPYNRRKHYGTTPTKSDRKAVGAGEGEVADHQPSLVERYYEGDSSIGEAPGYTMLPSERKASAGDRSRMTPQPRKESDAQGAEKSRYSREQKKKFGL